MKIKQFAFKSAALFTVFVLSAALFADALMSFASAAENNVTLSADYNDATDWVIEPVETNYTYYVGDSAAEEQGTVYTIKSAESGMYLTASFDSQGALTLVTAPREADNAGQRWLLRIPWNAPSSDPNYGSLSYALVNLGYTYEVSGKQVPALIKTDLTVVSLSNNGNGQYMWCINGGLGEKLPSEFTSFTTKLFGASPSNYLCEETQKSSEPYVKQYDAVLTAADNTEWVFEEAGIESYADYQGTVRSNQQLYTIKSKESGAYLTAVYSDDGSVTFETGSRNTSDRGQLWSFFRADGWGGFYNLINFGRMNDAAVDDGTVSVPTQIETDGEGVVLTTPLAHGAGTRSWFFNGEQNTIESLVSSQGSTDGSFTAAFSTQWPVLYFSEIIPETGRTADVLIKSSLSDDFSLSDVDSDDAYLWDVNYQTTENNKDYYTLYHHGTGLYLSIRNGKPVLAERDEFDTTQLWYFKECSEYGNQLAAWDNIYEIQRYGDITAIHTVESGEALEEDGLKFTSTTSFGEQGGRGWTLVKNRGTAELGKNNTCVINSYQWGKGGNYYLYAPVYRPLESVSLDETELKLVPGASYKLSLSLYPEDTTDTVEPVWETNDESVASVDQDGNITAHKLGTAVVTVTAGGKTASCTVTVEDINVEAVQLSRDKLSLTVGASYTLTAEVLPEGVTQEYSVSWKTDDDSVASVDSNGTVTALKAGEAVITCILETDSGIFSDECEIDVPVNGITSVSLSREKMEIILGENYKLDYSIAPDDNDAENIDVVFTSDNSDVAVVDGDGNITAAGIGKAIITVTVNELYTDTCEITVIHRGIESLTINKNSLELISGQSDTLTVEILPENTTVDKAVLWSSSRPAVAMVTGGKVTGIKPGTAQITATVGDKSVTCDVTVVSSDKTEELITWQGTLLDNDGLALRSHQITVGEKTAYTDQNGEFMLSDLPVGAITVEVRDADGELVLTKAILIEKGDNDSVNESVVTVAGDIMRLTIKINGSDAELTEYQTAKDYAGIDIPKTGDRAVLVMSFVFMLSSFLLLVYTLLRSATAGGKSPCD